MHDFDSPPLWVNTRGLPATCKGGPPRMAIIPCPPGGERLQFAIKSLQEHGIETMISLLRADETRILKLENEGKLCREAGMEYRWMPVQDHSIPESMDEFLLVIQLIHKELREGKGVGAHCFAGIGRSCMLLACVLCLEGLTPVEAFDRLSEARGLRVPDTWLQTQWVEHFAESALVSSHGAESAI